MSFNKLSLSDAPFAKTEVGNTFLKHALMIWAREQGVAEANLSAVSRDVLDFAQATVRDGDHRQALSA
ncbi:hypothetical protein CSW59_05100 [Caulobacter sp. BP25]|nr:hypothetical protein CSW59_05100 [Caulobacter sp. BP25]